MRARVVRTGVVLSWVGFVLATQRWLSWSDGIRLGFATDVRSYTAIARAAPSLPDRDLPPQHAERFPAHWLVGVLGDATGIGLHPLYRVLSLACLAAAVAAVAAALSALELPPKPFAVAVGVLVASAFPVHYLLAAPGMLSDAVFLLGISLVLLGFVRGAFPLVLAGLVVAVLGRQTAVPVAVAAAVWVAGAPAWRRRRLLAATTLVVPLAVYGLVHATADRFAFAQEGLTTWTVLGTRSPVDLLEHGVRTALGICVPAAIVLGAWWRTRRPPPRGALLVAAVVVAQPLLLSPAWASHNEPRLAALAAPALALAAGALLAQARLTGRETAILCGAVALASLHRLFTHVGVSRAPVWVALTLVAALVALAVLARRRTV
jgi:hypothetical protein